MAIKNDQYNQLRREYDARQFKNKHDLDLRREEVYQTIPAVKQLQEEMIALSAQSGRRALFGDENSLIDLREQLQDMQRKQTELLLSHGYPADYLDMHYSCSLCKDTGYVGNEKCKCFKQAIADMIYDSSNLKNILTAENFRNFSFSYYSDDYVDETVGASPLSNIQKIVAGCKNFIRHFNKVHENILFMGNTGVGKTFLANCIAKDLLDRGYTVIYLTAFRLFDILEKNKFGKDEEINYIASTQFEYILDCDLLIIDDLGTELVNAFTASQFYLIINERLLREKSTIISTNLSHDNLNANYGERVYSRLISKYSIRRIVGEDIRLHKAVNNN